jgi:hypothetical protein
LKRTPTQRIGDKWAKTIAEAFLKWEREVKVSGRKNIPSIKFDPTPFIEAAFYEGGEAQLEEIGKLLGVGVKFDLRNPEAEAWITEYGAAEVKYIDETARATIRQIVLRGQTEGLTPVAQAKLIEDHIGLHPRQLNALQSFEEGLVDLEETAKNKAVAKYRKRLLRQRALTISLTEGHKAANEGHRAANRDAVKRGVLDPEEWERAWLGTHDGRMCSICEGLVGARADLPDGQFDRGGGGGPPKHIRCRCCEILRRKIA